MFDNDNCLGCDDFDRSCKGIIEKYLTICVPVKTTPKVKVGKIKTECCGSPIVSSNRPENSCMEVVRGSCKFTIIQKMKVEIPIEFSADTEVEEEYVDCEFKKDNEGTLI